MVIIQRMLGLSKTKDKSVVVTFTGGMGAQIISTAVYFFLKNAGQSVYADLSYFDKSEHVAEAGNAGDCSHWAWQLAPFGLSPTSFPPLPLDLNKKHLEVLHDGARKLELGLQGLAQLDVQKMFEIPQGINDVLPGKDAENFLCIHIRRGDYVNVASHLIADEEFISIAKKFSGLLGCVAIISDSPISTAFRNAVSHFYKEVFFLDNINAFAAHRVMRNARVLICSNSQFSLISAALNPEALVFIPKQWFGDKDRQIEAPLHSRCLFQIMESNGA